MAPDRYLPFPPALAVWSTANATLASAARFEEGPESSTLTGVAAWRDQQGRFHACENLLDPWYPEGATPGIGTLHRIWRSYAGGDGGYRAHISDFVPADELLRSNPLHDPDRGYDPFSALALAHVERNGMAAFIWAHDEAQMGRFLTRVPEDTVVRRAVVSRHGADEPRLALIRLSDTGHLIFAGSDADTLFAECMTRQGSGETPDVDMRIVPDGPQPFLMRANAEASHVLGTRIVDDLLCERDIAMALVEVADHAVILHAPDQACLTAHIANHLLRAYDASRSDHRGMSDGQIIGRFWDEKTDLFIWSGAARLRHAHGVEPDRFGMILDAREMPPRILGYGSDTSEGLSVLIREGLGELRVSVPGADPEEIAAALVDHDDIRLSLMRSDDLDARIEKIRDRDGPDFNPF